MNPTPVPPIAVNSVRFSMSRWDVVRCRLWVLSHNKKLMGILLLMCIAVPALNYRPPRNIPATPAYVITFFLVEMIVMIAVMTVVQVVFHIFWVFVNKNRGVVGEHEFEIRDDGLLERTPVSESLHRWAGFHKIAASPSFLFVFVTDNIVHYIPLKVFSSLEDAGNFRAELHRRANAAAPTRIGL